MKQTKHFKRTAFPLSAKSMLSTLLLLIAMLMPQGAWAISGNGTASSPYLIANEADLRTFQQYVENGNSGIYGELTADITLTSAWTRIGRADRKFTGYFDGQGHTISGMNLSFTAYEHGFFGFVNNATIKNFTLKGTMTSSANGNHSHGTVVGSAAGTTVIENVTSSVNLTLNHTGFTCIGGIVGHMDESSKVIGCTYTGTINLNKDSEQVGGIVGYAQRNLYITNNVFSGTITSTGTCKYLAGIAGKTDGTIEVSGCTNIGTINGGPSFDCVAGIVGYVQYESRALITNCYFGGSLSSTSSGTSLVMGGILGAVNDEKGGNFRGLTYCFSDGTLTATSSSSTQIGGIAGVVKHKAVSMVTNNTYLSGKASRISAIDGSLSFDSSNKAITISVTAGTGGNVSKSYVYPTSTTATKLQVVATPNSGYHYVKWGDNGAQTHNVSLTDNVSLTATFGAHTYGNWTTDVDATCISSGTKHHNCSVCNVREDGTIPAKGHSLTGTAAKAATCTTAGNNKYWTCSTCKKVFSDEKATTETTVAAQTIKAKGHSLTGTAAKAATCTATGNNAYWTCSTCKKVFSNSTATTETTVAAQTIAALGHSYGAGAWSWDDDGHSATCTRTCSHDANHTSSVSVTLSNGITSELTEAATCSKKGSHTYTATTTVENVEYSDSKEVADIDIDPLNHNYGAGVWSWNNDGHSATCTRTCSYDANHTSSASVTLGNGIESVKLSDPTSCAEKGKTRYSATANVEGTQYSDTKEIADIAIPHTFADDDLAQGHCTVCNHGFFRYKSSTNKPVAPYYDEELKDAKNQKLTIISNTYADGKGVIEFNQPLVTIGQTAFWNRDDLIGDLTIPNTVTTIGIQAFCACSNLDGILTIPSSVKSIAMYAFADLWTLQAVKMASIPQVDIENVFNNTNCTKAVVLSDDSYVYKGSNPGFPTVASVTAPCTLDLTDSAVEKHANLTRTHNYTEESDAETYLASAAGCADATYYYKCANCTEHNSETWAKAGSGKGGHTFDDVTDPHHTLCTVCDHSFFRYTSTTKKAVAPNNADELKDAYDAKLDFTNTYDAVQGGVMEFNGTLKTIGENAFDGCSGFTGNLIIPNSVTSIGDFAFYGCYGFKGNLTIPNSVTSIGDAAFSGCYGFTGNLTIPNSVTSIGAVAFDGCKGFNGNLTISNSVTSIENYAFNGCSGFTGNLTIPNSVTSIGYSAFDGCSGFNGNLTIPNSVTSIDVCAFNNCNSFTGVKLQSVPKIRGNLAFCNVTSNKTVVLSNDSYVYKESNPDFPTVASVTAPCSLDLTRSAVAGHKNLTRTHNYTEESDAETYLASAAGCNDATYYYKCANCTEHNSETWAKAGSGKGGHTFAASDLTHDVCTVCKHGFLRYEADSQQTPYTAENLKDEYGNTLTIESHTFSDDHGVMEFNAPLVEIGDDAFFGCHVKGITIPNTVTTIGEMAFVYTDLTSINIPNSVKTIGMAAFAMCEALSNVTLGKSIESIGSAAFMQKNSNCNITLKSLPQITDDDYLNIFYYVASGLAIPIPANLELDDNSYVAPGSDLGSSSIANHVTYTRTGIKNQWGTIVVPFSVDCSGDYYDFYTLSSVSNDELTLTKVDETLPDGTPALIRINSELVGDGKTYDLTLTATDKYISTTGTLTGTDADGLTLTGSYSVKDITGEPGYIISNNKFWDIQSVKGTNKVYCAPFRAYLAGTLSSDAKALSIGISEEADAMEAITAITEGEAEYFDLNGRKLNSLQTGVNIVKYSNGKTKKVIVK